MAQRCHLAPPQYDRIRPLESEDLQGPSLLIQYVLQSSAGTLDQLTPWTTRSLEEFLEATQ